MFYLSIVVPAYRMHGLGADMLKLLLSSLKDQTYMDFEVVVSDQGEDNDIYNVCMSNIWQQNILYCKYNGAGASGNANNGIKNSSGRLIKIICLDDYFFDEHSLQKTVENFDDDKGWLVTDYMHTYDRKTIFKYQKPHFSNDILFENLIGTHSCLTFLNENPILFDENLLWYLDSDYYYRLYKRYGEPTYLREPTVVQLLWKGQATNSIVNDEMIAKEQKYLKEKYKDYNYGNH